MGEGPEERSKGGKVGLWVALAAIVIAGLGALALYLSNSGQIKAAAGPSPGAYQRFAVGSMKKLETSGAPSRLADLAFNDADGRPVDAARFRGKVVVLNLWATWCAPCVTEMPTLAALQRAYPDRVEVVAVSVDVEDHIPNARSFLGVHEPLAFYHDPRFALQSTLKFQGMPATILYDRSGREVARVMGEAKWDSPEARALIDEMLK